MALPGIGGAFFVILEMLLTKVIVTNFVTFLYICNNSNMNGSINTQ